MPKSSTLEPHVHEHREALAKRQPKPDDALNLAAIRWYVNRIENQAIGVYTAHPSAIGPIREAMFACLDTLAELEFDKSESCPIGYHREGNMCVPD